MKFVNIIDFLRKNWYNRFINGYRGNFESQKETGLDKTQTRKGIRFVAPRDAFLF